MKKKIPYVLSDQLNPFTNSQPTRELWTILCVSELFIMLVDKHINQWSIQFCWVDFSDQSNAWTLSDIEDRIYVTVWPSLMRKHVPTYTALIRYYLSPSVYIQRVTKIYVFFQYAGKKSFVLFKNKDLCYNPLLFCVKISDK